MNIPGDGLGALPVELFCNVFWLTINPLVARGDRCRLILVCRQWREFVECSPLLWTDISATQSIPYVRWALEKSRGAMIDIRCSLTRKSAEELVAFMAEVGPHIARWRSVMVWIPRAARDPESALAPLTTAQVPGLKNLKLVLVAGYLKDAITLFGGAPAPSTLKALTLLRVPVILKPLSLSNLVSLELQMVSTITTPQLLEILRGSTGLETLKLADNPGMVAIGSQATNIQPIELPKLVSLSLRKIEAGGVHCILSNIRVPNRRHVSIQGNARGCAAWSVLLTSAITHILHTTIPTIDTPSSAIQMEEFNGFDFSIKFRGIELRPIQAGGEDQLQEILRWIADGLESEAAICPVHLILDWSRTNSVRFASVPYPLVVKHLSFSDTTSEWLMKALYVAMGQPPHPTSDGWLFEQLESLRVGFATTGSQRQFVSMLKNRYVEATSTGETESRRPMNLRSVELRGIPRTEELVEEIRGILPEANVFWAR